MLLPGNDESGQPVFVYRHLLNGRALRRGTIHRTALDDETSHSCWDNIDILTIRVDLDSLRAIEMWSRWMWSRVRECGARTIVKPLTAIWNVL